MTKSVVLTRAVFLLLFASNADAQGRFQTGNLSWTPLITVRDAGLDTNVYDEPANPRRDHLAIVSPQVDGVLELGTGSLTMAGSADFVYFRRYTDERSINGRGSARLEVPLSRIRPFGGIAYQNGRERQNSEIDLRARRTDRELTAGIGLSLTSRASIEVSGRRTDSRFEQGEVFRGVELATRLNRDTTGAAARIRYDLSPLTTFTVDGDASRDRFVLSPGFDADNVRANVGFHFSPDAVIKGRAVVGYHKLIPRGPLSAGYDGVTTSVEIGYVLLGRTRFDARILRDTSSSLEAQPFYVQTLYGGEILHNLFGPVDVIGRASRERLDYQSMPDRALAGHVLDVNRYGGAVAIRAAERVRLTLTYEFAERLGGSLPDRYYERTRLFTTVSYGF
jgi:Putative beta-barrel porin 2